ncbi:MAG: hypothetical protein AAGC68_11125 [Verrucomicrobiota bacterium]
MKTEEYIEGVSESYGRYSAMKLMGFFIGLLGMTTGLLLITFWPPERNLDEWLWMLSPLLLYLGATLVFETVQWLFFSTGKRLRRAIWYGTYLFGVVVTPLFWILS